MVKTRKEIEAEVLSELSNVEQANTEAESQPKVVEEVEKSEEGIESKDNLENNSSSSQDVDKKDDGSNKSGYQKRIDALTRQNKEKAEALEAEKQARLNLEARLNAIESKSAEPTEDLNLDEPSKAYITNLVKDIVKDVIVEQEVKQKEQEIKAKQDSMINIFQTKVLEDYASHYNKEYDAYDDVATEQVTALFERVNSDPNYWIPKIQELGAKKTYKFLKGEFEQPVPKKEVFKSPASNSKVEVKPIATTKSNKEFLEEAIRQAIEELK